MSETLNVEKAVKDRYSQGAQEQVPELCCPVVYNKKYLEILPQEIQKDTLTRRSILCPGGYMRLFMVSLSVMASVILSVAAVQAESTRKGRRADVRHRQHHQHERIQQGVRSGELTKEEAKELRAEQKEVRETAREAISDGKVTREEKQEIRALQKDASQDIYQEKHDSEKR